ncbi:bile acid:sodium symporter family protein [Rhodospirillales bacterium]|jgi:BASS family bile acid:Na+ symporter|nr:bile acid:sodium symporter family protein [Rhodospirillales bacterium]
MNSITNIGLPIALAFIMFSLGLGLTGSDFKRVIQQPKDFLVGLLSQTVVLPVIAFLIVITFQLTPELGLGLMIIAAAPGGVTSNILTLLGRGDVALSISLTAVISLLSFITIPLIIGYSYNYLFSDNLTNEISLAKITYSIFAIVTVPVILGMAARYYFTSMSIKALNSARKISTVLFVIVLIGAIIKEKDLIIEYYQQTGLATLSLNIIMLLVAWLLATIFGSDIKQKISISIECGLQNGTLAIAVATLLFGGGPAAIPAATYSVTMFVTAVVFVLFLRRKYSS